MSNYWPVYGVDPVIVENGVAVGSKVTGANLVISAFETPLAIPPVFQTRLVPVFESGVAPPETRNGFRPAASSRHSARVAFETPIAGIGLTLVLNPPPELRQQMSAAKAKLIAPNALAEPVSYVYKNTILADYFWRFALSVFGSQTASGGYDVLYSRFLPLLEVEPGLHHFPYLKTSGADGSSPEFFDNTTPDGVREMIETVTNGGDFFIAVLFPADEIPFNSAAFAVDIVYPHSLARG